MEFAEVFRTTGRAPKPVSGEVLRPLTAVDLEALSDEKGSKPSALKRISDRHHALARNLAGGMGAGEAAAVCGLSPSRVAILQADPMFQDLLSFYRREVGLVYRDMHEKLAGVSSIALDELQDRLEDAPEDISIGQLLEVVKLGADRTGYGPQSSTTNLNINVGLASKLEAARKRVAERRALTIDGEIL